MHPQPSCRRPVLFLCLVMITLLFVGQPLASQASPSKPQPKIIGGSEALPDAWPWMVALIRSSVSDLFQAQFCGGVLIAPTWVLSAAHCVSGKTNSDIQVAVGAFDLDTFNGPRIAVKRIVTYPGYDPVDITGDLALLELKQPSTAPVLTLFSGKSQEHTPADLQGTLVTAIGWGQADTATTYYFPTKLRQLDLPVVANTLCANEYGTTLLSSQLCAGYGAGNGKDVCQGDSGGPLVARIDGQWVHIGLVSYGASCDPFKGDYGVYSRTSAFKDFISQYVPEALFTSDTGSSSPKGFPWLLFLLPKPRPAQN